MQIMRMSYSDVTKGGGEAKLHVYGVGIFPVFLVNNRTLITRTVPIGDTVQFQ